MGFFSKLFGRKNNEEVPVVLSPNGDEDDSIDFEALEYYVYFEKQVFGPYYLSEVRQLPLLPDTLITTNTLNNVWFHAQAFECFDDKFGIVTADEAMPRFTINEFGEVVEL